MGFFFPTSRTRFVYVGPHKSLQVRSYRDTKNKHGGVWLAVKTKEETDISLLEKKNGCSLSPPSLDLFFV